MKKVKSRKHGSMAASGRGRKKKIAPDKRVARNQLHPAKKRAPKNSALKTATPTTVDQYLATVPEPARTALQQIRAAIRSVVPPDATEIISYKIPAFKYKKVLVWYAAFANHCSLFPTAAVIEAFKDELKDFSTTKGTLHFPLDKPMPVELIKRLVKARVGRAKAKRESDSLALPPRLEMPNSFNSNFRAALGAPLYLVLVRRLIQSRYAPG